MGPTLSRHHGRLLLRALVLAAILLAAAESLPKRYERLRTGAWQDAWRRASAEDGAERGWQRVLGGDADAFARVRDLVPEDGFVVLRLPADADRPRRNRVLTAGRCALHPRRFYPDGAFREGVRRGLVPFSARAHVLDWAPDVPFEVLAETGGVWDEIARGDGWVLSRWRGGEE